MENKQGMKSIMKGLNVFSTIAAFILPLIFTFRTGFSLYYMINSKTELVLLLVCSVLIVIAFLGSAVQGIRSISNGRAKTIVSASVFQLILYALQSIIAGIVMYWQRNSSYAGTRNFCRTFIIFFVILMLISVLKIFIAIRNPENGYVTEREKKTARRLGVSFVAVPASIILLFVFLMKFPKVAETIGMVFTVIIAIIVLAVVLFLLYKVFMGLAFVDTAGSGPVESKPSPSVRKSPASNNRKQDNSGSSAVARELDNQYIEEYKIITGSHPELLDWHILKDGPKLEAVKALRKRMKQEAEKKGVEGQTKWF